MEGDAASVHDQRRERRGELADSTTSVRGELADGAENSGRARRACHATLRHLGERAPSRSSCCHGAPCHTALRHHTPRPQHAPRLAVLPRRTRTPAPHLAVLPAVLPWNIRLRSWCSTSQTVSPWSPSASVVRPKAGVNRRRRQVCKIRERRNGIEDSKTQSHL